MWLNLVAILYAVYIFTQQCCGLNFIELPGFHSDENPKNRGPHSRNMKGEEFNHKEPYNTEDEDFMRREQQQKRNDYVDHQIRAKTQKQYPPVRSIRTQQTPELRRYWLVSNTNTDETDTPTINMEDKDASLKGKISTLVQQTMHDTEVRVKSIQKEKEKNRDKAPYKIGFILSMVKKSRDVLNELFNVAVKHRDEWKALEQLKIFELIVHTNVDTTNLVRQLVEIHIQHLNTTKSSNDDNDEKRRVVLL